VRYKEASAAIRKFALTVLLCISAGIGFAQSTMAINYVSGFDVPYSHRAVSMQGDQLESQGGKVKRVS
jgi:hypothetical protein